GEGLSLLMTGCGRGPPSLLHDMPDAALAVAHGITGLLVFGIVIKRVSVIGPLLGPVLALRLGPVLAHLVALMDGIRRPSLGAIVIAGRNLALVLVESVERHALGIGQHSGRKGSRGASERGKHC